MVRRISREFAGVFFELTRLDVTASVSAQQRGVIADGCQKIGDLLVGDNKSWLQDRVAFAVRVREA